MLRVVDVERIGHQLGAREVRRHGQREVLAGNAGGELLRFGSPAHAESLSSPAAREINYYWISISVRSR